MGKGLSALALAEVATGSLLAWSGISNASMTATLRSVLAGKAPAAGTGGEPITGTTTGDLTTTTGTGPASDSAIASAAEQFQGHCYSYGGAPGPDGAGCWDCSSFCNYVLGVKLSMAIPGFAAGAYRGQTHGPDTLSWLAWSGCTTVGHSSTAAQPGDLLVYQTHMGICIGPNQMISAEDPANGTATSSISGMTANLGEVLFVRRLR
jgi:cell wall-associated NlpC family hydrolase